MSIYCFCLLEFCRSCNMLSMSDYQVELPLVLDIFTNNFTDLYHQTKLMSPALLVYNRVRLVKEFNSH